MWPALPPMAPAAILRIPFSFDLDVFAEARKKNYHYILHYTLHLQQNAVNPDYHELQT
jgi:hypothetical protein